MRHRFSVVFFTFPSPDLGRYHTAIMCYWGSHQDGSISPKNNQAKVVAHHPYFIPHVYITDPYIFSLPLVTHLVL
jgi:hypothetical protein